MNLADGESPPTPDQSVGTLTPTYRDRSTPIFAFGVLEILGGGLAALMVPFMLLGLAFGRRASGSTVPLRSIVPSALSYAILAGVLITLGIGTVLIKRWARALNLIVSWLWLIMGVLVTALLIWVMPSAFLAGMHSADLRTPSGPQLPTLFAAVVLTFVIVICAIFLIVLPIVFLFFYRSKNVEETFRHRDPVERWTDRRPLPVIAAALLYSSAALYFVLISFITPLFPFFGKYLVGPAGAVIFLVMAAIYVYIAVSMLHLKLRGWWVAIIVMAFHIVSGALTYARADLLQAYSRMGWSEAQIDAVRRNPILRTGAFLWWSLGIGIAHFVFLCWLRRYFSPREDLNYTGGDSGFSNSMQAGG